jgi:polar amino acid transport system substrate-binding protein
LTRSSSTPPPPTTSPIRSSKEVKDGVVVGLFPAAGEQEYFGLTFETGSPLVQCANLALEELKADGSLDAIHQRWLVEKTNVGEVPEFTT